MTSSTSQPDAAPPPDVRKVSDLPLLRPKMLQGLRPRLGRSPNE